MLLAAVVARADAAAAQARTANLLNKEDTISCHVLGGARGRGEGAANVLNAVVCACRPYCQGLCSCGKSCRFLLCIGAASTWPSRAGRHSTMRLSTAVSYISTLRYALYA